MPRWFAMFDRRAILLLPLLLTGCVGVIVGGFIWETRESTGTVVWSDDGQRVAGIHTSFEITVNADPPIIPGRVRNARYQLFTCDLKGSGKKVLGSERAGRLESAFYMKQAGYVLGKEHWDESGAVQFLKWPLRGREPKVLWRLDRPQYDAFIRLVPSRDGKVLAQCRLSAGGLRDGKATVLVSLLDAATFKPRAEAVVPMRCDSEPSLDVQWLPDGRLRITCFSATRCGGGGDGRLSDARAGSARIGAGDQQQPDQCARAVSAGLQAGWFGGHFRRRRWQLILPFEPLGACSAHVPFLLPVDGICVAGFARGKRGQGWTTQFCSDPL